MALKIITPATQAIPTVDLRVHLRATSDASEDALIVAQLMAAQEFCQHYTGKAIGSQTLELALDAFPDGPIELPFAPVTGVTSVKYLDLLGVEQTLSNTLYVVDDYGVQHWLVPMAGTEWPETQDAANAVKVRYVAGSIPAAVNAALLMMVGHLYENRESTAPIDLRELPMGVKALLDTCRIWSM